MTDKIDYAAEQAKRERTAAHKGLVVLKRRAVAAADGELLSAVEAIEVVLGDITAVEMANSFSGKSI